MYVHVCVHANHHCACVCVCVCVCACVCIIILCEYHSSLISRPFKWRGERAWYTLQVHALGDPRKNWGNRILSYTLRLSSIELHVMQNPQTITMVTRLVAMETPVHMHAMCTRPFLLLSIERPGYEASALCAQFLQTLEERLKLLYLVTSKIPLSTQ